MISVQPVTSNKDTEVTELIEFSESFIEMELMCYSMYILCALYL